MCVKKRKKKKERKRGNHFQFLSKPHVMFHLLKVQQDIPDYKKERGKEEVRAIYVTHRTKEEKNREVQGKRKKREEKVFCEAGLPNNPFT